MPPTANRRAPAISLVISGALMLTAGGAVLAQDGTEMSAEPTIVSYDFEPDAQGWEPLLVDLPDGYDPTVGDLLTEWRPLPEGLEGHGLYSQGANRSDDMFMSWKARVDGLEPSTTYIVDADLTLASNMPAEIAGERNSPAEVYVKIGAVGYEPLAVVDDLDGWLRLSAHKGLEEEGGRDAVVVGTIANPNLELGEDFKTFALMDLSSRDLGLTATTDEAGVLWLFMGTDSGYEGFTTQFYDELQVTLTPTDSEMATAE